MTTKTIILPNQP